jgi:HD-like signal output (HDOD) protein
MDDRHPVVQELYERGVAARLAKLQANDPIIEMERAFFGRVGDTSLAVDPFSQTDPASQPDEDELELPSLPQVYTELQYVIADPQTTVEDIARIISSDAGLVTRVLRVVNSAAYRTTARVDSIKRAVAVLGSWQVSTLAMSVCVLSTFRNVPTNLVDMQSFWRSNVAAGALARELGLAMHIQDIERCFTAGLLHDLGRLILLMNFPEQENAAMERSREAQMSLFQAEAEAFGFDQTVLAALVFKRWRFPTELIDSIRWHRRPRAAIDARQATIVHLADVVARCLGMGISGDYYAAPLDEDAWDRLHLPLDEFCAIIDNSGPAIADLTAILLGDGG